LQKAVLLKNGQCSEVLPLSAAKVLKFYRVKLFVLLELTYKMQEGKADGSSKSVLKKSTYLFVKRCFIA